jgi:hypothetical protein
MKKNTKLLSMRNKDILYYAFLFNITICGVLILMNIFELRNSTNTELLLALLYEMFLCIIFAELYFEKKDKNENNF